MFKIFNFSAILVATSLLAANANAAQSNTIRFVGEVNAQTCDISINNATNATPIVLLQPAKISQLSKANDVSTTEARFKVALTNCAASAKETQIGVRFASNNTTTTGDLANTAASSSASNVAIRLFNDKGDKIDLSSGSAKASGLTLAANATSAEAEFIAKYVAVNGAATAGNVESTVQYAISYQ